jgi:hypothetical protein
MAVSVAALCHNIICKLIMDQPFLEGFRQWLMSNANLEPLCKMLMCKTAEDDHGNFGKVHRDLNT